MATSAVPAAIDAFLALVQGADGMDGVRVIDGPPGVNFTEKDRVYVGFSPSGDQAAEMQQQFASAGARLRDEDGAISGYIESRRGDTSIRDRRLRVFEILAVIENGLRATNGNPTAPTLSGTVLWSGLTAGALAQSQESGALAGLSFTVHFRARI
ncbi:hypothetical protein PV518_17900 [Streptomyces sp. ND04-05B]|uniref:hypothetical protein n=1 Tax=Streptomyces sp. ND04-05B TaxID=3028693 RepID=UPI0029A1D333|nr:hypothetical protein [Streptomyces sp. ND04-05B]MDX3064035.1 hypothetical protein [Streptomyces sp. ND04-05B]